MLFFADLRRNPILQMDFGKILVLSALMFSAATAVAKDGKAEYELLCGACHSPDGKGAGEGAFPPLAGSEWVKGDAERLVQVILHGMDGPVKVAGKSYNLTMPPQGAALTNAQIAAIGTYVRKAWGNNGGGIDEAFVKAARANSAKRNTMWKAEELLKRWPFPKKKGPLKDLIATVYKGDFKQMPDFSKLEPIALEEEAAGFVDLDTLGEKEGFAVVWEGSFQVKRKGDHIFRLDSDDGSRVFVDGKKVVEVKGPGGMGRAREGRVLLEKGMSKIRVEYFELRGQEGISLSMRRGKEQTLLTRTQSKNGPKYPPIPLVVKDEARIYRNFIKGTSARGIGVGYPGGLNLAFSADDLGIGLAWMGEFIDAGLHWHGRGQGSQPPAGQRVVSFGAGPSFAMFSEELTPWPKEWQPELEARFGGYVLDKKRRPDFRYEVAGVKICDKPEAIEGRIFVRNIRLHVGENPPQGLSLRLSGGGVKAINSHSFEIGNGVRIEVAKSDVVEPVVTKDGVILRLKLKPGGNRIGVRYVWK